MKSFPSHTTVGNQALYDHASITLSPVLKNDFFQTFQKEATWLFLFFIRATGEFQTHANSQCYDAFYIATQLLYQTHLELRCCEFKASGFEALYNGTPSA
jgi:hypothetical protein